MRKGRDGEKKRGGKKREKKEEKKREKTDENSGHYVIASSRPPERRPLECRTLAPIGKMDQKMQCRLPVTLFKYSYALNKT